MQSMEHNGVVCEILMRGDLHVGNTLLAMALCRAGLGAPAPIETRDSKPKRSWIEA